MRSGKLCPRSVVPEDQGGGEEQKAADEARRTPTVDWNGLLVLTCRQHKRGLQLPDCERLRRCIIDTVSYIHVANPRLGTVSSLSTLCSFVNLQNLQFVSASTGVWHHGPTGTWPRAGNLKTSQNFACREKSGSSLGGTFRNES